MTKEITVSEKIDSSTALQKLIDSTGNTPAKFTFTEDHDIEINSLLRFNNYFEWNGSNCKIHMMENAPTSTFASGIPLMAPKNQASAEGLCFHDFRYDGERDEQKYVEKLYEHAWGHGFHNVLMLGQFSCVGYEHAKNCSIYNIDYQNSIGDLLRGEGVSNFTAHDITIRRGGHDGIYVVASNSEIYNISGVLSSNSGVRTRSSHNVKIHDCKFNNSDKLAYSPGIQIQSTAKNWTSKDIEIYNCEINGTYGPGIQIAANSNGTGNGLVSVHNCLFKGCGNMPSANKLPYVGAIVFNGHNVNIYNNTFDSNYGYALLAGNYNVGNKNSYAALITQNIVTNTKASNYKGTASGSGIADLLGTYTWSCSKNNVWGNVTNLYKVSNSNGLSVDPLYNSDYSLKDGSPCAAWGFAGSSDSSTQTSTTTPSGSTATYTPVTGTASDVKNVYSSPATSFALQPAFTLKANGRAIRLDSVALALAVQRAGIVSTCRITAQEAGGPEVVLKDWATNKVQYVPYSKTFSRAFSKGKNVTVRWYLKTSNKAYRAYLKNPTVKYTLL